MADVKISGLPSDSSLDGNHYVPINDPTGPATKRTLLSVLASWFFDQLNIPDGSGSPVTRMVESGRDFVSTGLVWTGDAYASTRNASMTAGLVYINGRRILISAVVARSFTASKDTYVDVLDNADGTGTLVYTEVTNNAASPALASNSLRVAIVVTGASNIASVASINQGQVGKILPIASNIPYTVCDSLGNLIYNKVPRPVLLAQRKQSAAQSGVTSIVDLTGQTATIILTEARNIKITAQNNTVSTVAMDRSGLSVWANGVQVQTDYNKHPSTDSSFHVVSGFTTLAAGTHTIKARGERISGTGTITFDTIGFMSVEMV